VADRLLDAIEALHGLGLGAGLLQPSNVLFRPGPGGSVESIVLPDVGFVYFRGFLPPWLRNGETRKDRQKYAELWDEEPQAMNERTIDRRRYPKLGAKFPESGRLSRAVELDPKVDVRTAGRLIAWLLADDGIVRRTMPTRDKAPWAKAEVWSVLDDAAAGRIGSAAEFRDRLFKREETRPSAHFHEQVEPEARADSGRGRWIALGLLGLLLAAGLAAYMFFVVPAKPIAVHPYCETCLETSPLYKLLDQYQEAGDDPAAEGPIVARMYDPATYAPREANEAERGCRDKARDEALKHLEIAAERLRLRAFRAPNPVLDKSDAASVDAAFIRLFELKEPRRFDPEKDYPPWLTQLRAVIKDLN
jgi:hypothetical protein